MKLLIVALLLLSIVSRVVFAQEGAKMTPPPDPVVTPAHLENMRPGQIRDAVAKGYTCLLPVGTIEYAAADVPLGIRAELYREELAKLAKARKAVIAPPLWYAPTGYVKSAAKQGTVDISPKAFEAYLEDVVGELTRVGFRQVEMVLVNNPQGKDSLLHTSCRFVIGNLFNKTWREPDLGVGWVKKLDEKQLGAMYGRHRLTELRAGAKRRKVSGKRAKRPMLLENMTSAELAAAIRAGAPCYLPVGVLEGHGNQNPVGVDAIHAHEPVRMAAREVPIVVAPTIWYGGTAHWAGGPRDGDLSIGGPEFRNYLATTVAGLLKLGFRNLIVAQCHQGGGAQRGAVAAVLAGQRARFQRLRREGRIAKEDIPVLEFNVGFDRAIGDHAGRNETSLMLFLRPEHTDLALLREGDFPFCWRPGGRAADATLERGQEAINNVVDDIVAAMKKRARPQKR